MKRALLLSLIAGMPGAASAAAWTQEEGEAVVILQIAGALAEARFNAFGTRTESDRFESVEGRVYAEYGLFDAYTLVASGGFKQFTAEPNPAVQGADPFELALRVRLFTWENNVVSVQPGVRIPGSFSGGGGDVPFGSEDFDVEGRALFGSKGEIFGITYFTNTEAAYRHRMGPEPDELISDITIGVDVFSDVQILIQGFSTYAIGEAEPPYQFFQQHKAQVSAIYRVYDGIAIQAGGYMTLYGQNVIDEQGVFVAVWVPFAL